MKKTLFLILCFSSILLLCAWSIFEVELLDDTKLLDLSKAIELAKAGGDSLTDTDDDSEINSDENTGNNHPSYANDSKEVIVTVSIRDEYITFNSFPVEDISEIESRIRGYENKKLKVSLVDNWAEAHVYREVRKLLSDLSNELGFEFTYE